MRQLVRYLHPSVLATNVSTACLWIEFASLIAIPIVGVSGHPGAVHYLARTFAGSALIGIPCALLGANQAVVGRPRSS